MALGVANLSQPARILALACLAAARGGEKGVHAPLPYMYFGRLVNNILTRGADCAHHITSYSTPDSQTFRHPCVPCFVCF